MLPKPLPQGDESALPRRRRLDELIPVEHRTRWPIHVPPMPKEPIHSWAARASHRYGLTPRQFLTALGIPNEQTSARLLAHVPEHLAKITAALGRIPTGYQFQDNRSVAKPYISDAPSQYCPRCLAETGAWSTDWQTEWALTCPTHQILLNISCPACDSSQWTPSSWLSRTALPHRCTERTPTTPSTTGRSSVREWCNQDLREASTRPAPPELIEAQQTLHQALRDQAATPDALHPFGPWEFVTAHQKAHAFKKLISYTATQPPGLGGQVATLLEAWNAYTELSSTPGTGPNLKRLLDDPSKTGLLGPPRTAQASALGPILTAVGLRQHGHLSANKQLAFRTGRSWPAHPADWSTNSSHPTQNAEQLLLPEHQTKPISPPAEWIPQVLWPGFNTKTPTDDPGERATQSMLLLHLGRASRWSHLALELGLPRQLQHQARTHVQHLAATKWAEQIACLEHQFNRLLDSPPPINYRIRRVVAHDPADLQRALHQATRTNPGPDLIRHFWEAFTGGDISLAPPPLGMDPTSSQYAIFKTQRPTARTEHESDFTKALGFLQHEYGMAPGEPLVWSPPP